MFLLGSGVSIPGGFPGTVELTSQILAGNGIVRHTDGRYYLAGKLNYLEGHPNDDHLSKVVSLLEVIQQLMGEYEKLEPLNYEILYYFIQQLSAFESGDLLNMALFPFMNQVKQRMWPTITGPDELIHIFGEAEKSTLDIRCGVDWLLTWVIISI